jgi:c-di-GMP-binding flagellar brake protein YcgR
MLLKPGNEVKIIDRKKNTSGDAVIMTAVTAGEKEFSLAIMSVLSLYPGDEITLEAPQREDALYIIRATVLEVLDGGACILKQLGEEQRWQRRKSGRIPVNYRAEYVLLSEKVDVNSFKQAKILNISRGGALLMVKTPLELMGELQLFFEISLNREREISTGMKGKVVREHLLATGDHDEWQYSYGVEFEEPFYALSG